MTIKVQDGVYMQVFPTQKFKTQHIQIYFNDELSVEKLASRALLSRMLDLSTKNYPSQKKLGEALSHLYGAHFSANSSRIGRTSVFQFSFVFPNSNYLPEGVDLASENLALIEEVLFHPNASGGQFDQDLFDREKENLIKEIDSLADDKRAYAALRLNELFYDDPAYQVASLGRKEDVEAITAESLYQDYLNIIHNNAVDIMVMGDVDKKELKAAFQTLPFQARGDGHMEHFYVPKHREDFTVSTDIQDLKQAKFNLAYQTPVYHLNDQYFSGLVMNGLFGGFPHSKLFINVREKESLAYYASSSLNTFTGKMTVQTGIDKDTMKKTNSIIQDQFSDLQAGRFTEEDFDQTIKALKNGRLQGEDSAHVTLRRAYREILAQDQLLPLEEWLEGLQAVTPDDVIQVARASELKATYFLQGEGD